MTTPETCGICGAKSIRKDGHIFHKTDDCIRNLEAQVMSLRSQVAELKAVGEKMFEKRAKFDARVDRVLCAFCDDLLYAKGHYPECPGIEWRQLLKQIEEGE